MEPFEDGEVLVRFLGVAVDAGIGEAGEDLVVAGIRELHGVRDLRRAPGREVAVDLAFLRDLRPEERQQCLASLFRRFAPELGFDGLHIGNAADVLADELLLGPGEHFLPAEPISRDEDDVLRFQIGGGGGCSAGEQEGDDEREQGGKVVQVDGHERGSRRWEGL